MTTSTTPKIPREDLENHARLAARKKELEREARAIGTELSAIVARIEAAMQAANRTQATRYGFQIAYREGRATVRWKDAFIATAGADRAAQLQREANEQRPLVLAVTPPADFEAGPAVAVARSA